MKQERAHKSEVREQRQKRKRRRVSGKSVFLLAKIIREKSK